MFSDHDLDWCDDAGQVFDSELAKSRACQENGSLLPHNQTVSSGSSVNYPSSMFQSSVITIASN